MKNLVNEQLDDILKGKQPQEIRSDILKKYPFLKSIININFKNIHTENDIKRFFPNAKKIVEKITHAFWELEPKIFMKIIFKNNSKNKFQSTFANYISDIDYNKFDVESVYIEKRKGQFETIYKEY